MSVYRNWYKPHRPRQVDGHYERKISESAAWERCAKSDAMRSLGRATTEELRRHHGLARSERGAMYRWVRHAATDEGDGLRRAG